MTLARSTMTVRVLLFAALSAAAAMPRLCDASEAPPPIINPKTYSSPSGEFALEVDPSTMYGQGEARYRLTRGGKEVWTATHPFTFWEAAVTDEGASAGYAYQHGPGGFAPGGRRADPTPGKFHIAILAPDGKTRRLDSTDRERSRFLHDEPNPLVNGMFVDAGGSRLVVRLRNPDVNQGGERWRVFDVTNGDDLASADVPPGAASMRSLMEALPVKGTPLVILHWWHYDDRAQRNPGAAFTLIDLSDPAKPGEVWRRVLPGDYFVADTKEDPHASLRLIDRMRDEGAILRCDEPRRFDLHFVAEKARVTFEVSPAPAADGRGGWAVREIARGAYDLPQPEPAAEPELAALELRPLGELRLVGPGRRARQPIRDVYDFDVDDRGRIGFIRGEPGDEARCKFVLLDAKGGVAIDATPFLAPADAEASAQHIAWLRGDRWVITDSGHGPGAESRAWFVDVDAERRRADVRKLDGFEAAHVESLVSTRDGGFVALCDRHHQFTITHELSRYDADGRRVWTIDSDFGNDAVLFSPRDCALDPTDGGSIVVLNGIRDQLQVVGLDGIPKRRIDLAEAFGQEPNYPSALAIALDGTLVVGDFNGSPPIWRLKNDGTRIDHLTPRFPDGRRLNVRGLRLDAKGRIWTDDGSMILRLNGKGVVDRALGDPPDSDAAGKIGALAVSLGGEIYVAASRGGVVRVFGPSGRLLRTLKARPTDFASDEEIQRLTVDGNGDVYIAGWDGPYLHINADGTRVGREQQALDDVKEQWAFQPGTRQRWVAGYKMVWLVDESGEPAREIRRQPDGRWIAHPRDMAVAPDGSLALTANDGMRPSGEDGGGNRLNFYTPAGEPVRTIPLPLDGIGVRVAFNGRRAVVAGDDGLLLADPQDGTLRRLTFGVARPGAERAYWQPAFSPDGSELWLIDRNAGDGRIQRYAIDE